MKRTQCLGIFAALLLGLPFGVRAQETCGDQAGYDACIATAKATCATSFPQCEEQPLSIEELRAAIEERCPCDTARNFGKYRSCVAILTNALKKFNIIDAETLALVKADIQVCKEEIKDRKKNQGKNPNND